MAERIENFNPSEQVEEQKTNWGRGGEILGKIVFALVWVILVGLILSTMILPLYMIVTSLKLNDLEYQFHPSPFSFPETPTWSNYSRILEIFNDRMETSLLSMFLVSIVTSTLKPAIGVLVTTIWGYVIAKYAFFGREFFFKLGIVIMILPIVGSTASAMQVNKALGVYDNLFMNIITSAGGGFYGTNFLLMYGTFKGIPWDYAEAAQIDGASRFTILFKLYMRMALPQMTVLFVLAFMASWNDYSIFMVWLPSYPNIAYGMYLFNKRAQQYRVSLPQLMAGFTMVMIPVAIIYLSTQKIITSKFAIGGLKG